MFLSALVALTSHVTINPNFGAYSGGYFHVTFRVPHGLAGLHTTGLEIHVPHGVLVAKPEIPEDWTAQIETRRLDETEQYSSHGALVTDAPHRITLTSLSHGDGVHDDHLLNIDMQLKIGCLFQDPASNTLWNKEYTLWWIVKQICEDPNGTRSILSWNGTQRDAVDGSSPSWSALPAGTKPAPYLYVEPGERCSIDHSGSEFHGGLLWFGEHRTYDVADAVTQPSSALEYVTLLLSIFGVVLSSIATAFWTVLVCFRIHDKKKFTEKLIGVEVPFGNGHAL